MENAKSLVRYYKTVFFLIAGLLIISFLGFNTSYFNLFPGFPGTSWVIHFHVIPILCWFAMLIVQALLAKKGQFDMHRKVGQLSFLLVPVIVIGFALVTNHGQLKHKAPDLLGATLFDGSLFLLFYTLAMINNKNTTSHAQYMILSAVPFINPGLGRFISPEVSLPVEFLLILTLFLTAYFKKKPYRPYLIALGSFVFLLGIIVYISLINPPIIEGMWNAIWDRQLKS